MESRKWTSSAVKGTSCLDCPVRSEGLSAVGRCCAQQSGLYSDGFDPVDFEIETFEFDEAATSTLGILHPMEHSERLWEAGRAVIPGGTQTLGKGPIGFIDGVAPKYLSHGKGARVWDVDGNEFLDCWLACLPITFGHQVPEIDSAITEQLKQGITFSLMHPLEVKAAEMLVEDIPIAEQVRFAKNGSDVCEAAVRLARFTTGKNYVVTFGYHGFHDWYVGSTDRYYGIPEAVQKLTLRTIYNDLDHLRGLFAATRDDIACVIMEPTIFEFPADGYLSELKELVHSHGALLIFDEMLTGYRFSRHGAMSFFDVEPDLATFGKGIANGMPIGMLLGPERYMNGFQEVFFSSTYGGETLSLAATVAGLQYHRDHDVIGHMWKIGKIVMDGFNNAIEMRGIQTRVAATGYPVRQTLSFRDEAGNPDFELGGVFQQEMLKAGVLCNSGLGFSHMHSENDAMFVVRAFNRAADRMAEAIDSGDVGRFLEGIPAQPVFRGLRNQNVTSN